MAEVWPEQKKIMSKKRKKCLYLLSSQVLADELEEKVSLVVGNMLNSDAR